MYIDYTKQWDSKELSMTGKKKNKHSKNSPGSSNLIQFTDFRN